MPAEEVPRHTTFSKSVSVNIRGPESYNIEFFHGARTRSGLFLFVDVVYPLGNADIDRALDDFLRLSELMIANAINYRDSIEIHFIATYYETDGEFGYFNTHETELQPNASSVRFITRLNIINCSGIDDREGAICCGTNICENLYRSLSHDIELELNINV